jgi:predicted AAA+ superfamily ATPase
MIENNTQLFEAPSTLGQIRIEYLYNLKYGTIPSKLNINESLYADKTIKYVSKYFDSFSVEYTSRGDSLSRGSYWLGKVGMPFEGVVLETSDSERSGEYPSIAVEEFTIRRRGNKRKVEEPELCTISAVGPDEAVLKKLWEKLKEFNYVSKSKIYLLATQYGEVTLKPLDVPESTSDLTLNYGSKFPSLHDEIINSLNNKSSGLYLFYGEPGTGKSSYIKHLLSVISERKIVYIPINLIDHLVSPDFIPLLMNNRNMILVIEDAEKALVSREENTGNASIVSAILNLTDSFISSTLNVTIIATFNTKKENLDKALLRKGRLKFSHEFDKLSVEDSQKLIDSLNIDHKAVSPMTIAEIYYLTEDNHLQKEEPKKVIGFGGV